MFVNHHHGGVGRACGVGGGLVVTLGVAVGVGVVLGVGVVDGVGEGVGALYSSALALIVGKSSALGVGRVGKWIFFALQGGEFLAAPVADMPHGVNVFNVFSDFPSRTGSGE
jgi:hypothetical protein